MVEAPTSSASFLKLSDSAPPSATMRLAVSRSFKRREAFCLCLNFPEFPWSGVSEENITLLFGITVLYLGRCLLSMAAVLQEC